MLRFFAGVVVSGAATLAVLETHPRTKVNAAILHYRDGPHTRVWRNNPYGSAFGRDDGEWVECADIDAAVADGLQRSWVEAPAFWRWVYGRE